MYCPLSIAGIDPHLKGLSHKIEIGCRWYGYLEMYVKRCRWGFIIFLISLPIYYLLLQ
jgi:hypothetical protein